MVTVASCFGSFIFQGIDPANRAPFYGFIAPIEKVSPEEIAVGFHLLFERIIRTDQFDEAVLALRASTEGATPKFTYQHCETTFSVVLENLGAQMRDPVYRQRKALALTVKSLSNVNVRLNHTIPGIVGYYQDFVSRSDEHLLKMRDYFVMKDLQ
jgi:hypothetical protein